MKFIQTRLALGLIILFCASARAQNYDITLILKSEHKQLFSESGMINDILISKYNSKLIELNRGIADVVRNVVKEMTGQTMHADKIAHSTRPYFKLINSDNKIYLSFYFTSNNISFKVTTPDIAYGIGVGEYNDPTVSIHFDVRADFELKQGSSIEMIKFIRPVWSIKGRSLKASNLQKLSLEKDELDQWYKYSMSYYFKPVYNALFDVKDDLNKYLQEVLKNPELQMEFEIDGNRQVKVIADESASRLIFQHHYSKDGIVKRSVKKNADALTGKKVSTPSTVPVSNSPVKKKNQVLSKPKKGQIPKRNK